MGKLRIFEGKRVLVTGNTGFKGSWLVEWLLHLKADVIGFANDIPSNPSHFAISGMEGRIHQTWGDVRKFHEIHELIAKNKPDFVFHLAAQALVKKSYLEPRSTFETNVLGTLNVLDSLRICNERCTAVIITSDKCYDNIEQEWGYRENDQLGGKDPYSGSKGAAELVIRSYAASYFKKQTSNIRIGIGRAGNVIGGGDWAADRIVPDAVRAWGHGDILDIRSPNSTRPWQLVLEPLSGYLNLAVCLEENPALNGEAFNFGPAAEQNKTVKDLLDEMGRHWPDAHWRDISDKTANYEAGLLKLNCDKALSRLGWKPTLKFEETVKMTSDWYKKYYIADDAASSDGIHALSVGQIAEYEGLAKQRGVTWAL